METLQNPTETKARKEHQCEFCLGKIEKGSIYLKGVFKIDHVYTWKNHKYCQEIADKLRMYDNCDEGVTTDDFIETIKEEYAKIMADTQNEIWESKEFVLPEFQEKLQFVLKHHGINH